ncbi:phosphoheptose isomerase [Actinomycetospora sp. NBRC 106375]|uniref:D-sedoheptulose-7-phosphate isomerase n=1 Tax=Actinomycetospora sp. NBRC 106375 TaxID=3032207 RepID=UPI0024A1E963|nr:SIS domain-containing protein [Actinomycetospora sp. NBRC 106375]GLZ44157.1 phosphoheptose isomerase [Actinomycetospora sp. NBRC 106375]
MSGIESLYPFLYGEAEATSPAGDTGGSVFDDVRRSTREKVAEIAALREQVIAEYAEALASCAIAIAASFAGGGRLWAFGNGGSSTDAQAVAALFAAPETEGAVCLPAVALTADVAALTALSNDVSFDVVFARPLAAAGRPGDVAFALSTSGGSANVLRGLAEARHRGLVTVGLAGYDGGAMAEPGAVDHLFVMRSSSVHRIQEAQTTVYQVLGELTRRALGAPAGPATDG